MVTEKDPKTEEKEEEKEEETQTSTSTEEKETWDEDRAKRTINQQRESERVLKRELATTAAKLKEYEDKNKTESEKTQLELDRLKGIEQEYARDKRERNTRDAFVAEAEKAGALKPVALLRLADNLEVDDSGKPINLADVIKSLKSEYPELFAGGSANGSSGRGQPTSQNMSDRMRASLRGR